MVGYYLWFLSGNKIHLFKLVGQKTKWTYEEWANRLSANFEKHFFVGEYDQHTLINKRGIYKDTLNSSQPWTDFQLRCNFPIAMVAVSTGHYYYFRHINFFSFIIFQAPEMFEPKHAWEALNMAKKKLLGPLGMCTLDPDDWAYNGTYNNDNDTDDPRLAHGANYHQGPVSDLKEHQFTK